MSLINGPRDALLSLREIYQRPLASVTVTEVRALIEEGLASVAFHDDRQRRRIAAPFKAKPDETLRGQEIAGLILAGCNGPDPSCAPSTPAQRYADRLAYFADVFCKAADRETYLLRHKEFVELRKIVNEIFPPAPPTVEELAAMLREVVKINRRFGITEQADAAEALLARVPK